MNSGTGLNNLPPPPQTFLKLQGTVEGLDWLSTSDAIWDGKKRIQDDFVLDNLDTI